MEKKQTAMTPKEKAEELVDKFHIIETSHWNENMDGRMTMEQIGFYSAKQCALIAVDEIINSSPARSPINDGSDAMPHFRAVKYWEQVKQEIEKL